MGIDNVVVDSSSIEVNRRKRRAKTDRIDGEHLLVKLMRYHAGERGGWSVLRVHGVAEEDARRLHRELERLKRERGSHQSFALVLHLVESRLADQAAPAHQVLPRHLGERGQEPAVDRRGHLRAAGHRIEAVEPRSLAAFAATDSEREPVRERDLASLLADSGPRSDQYDRGKQPILSRNVLDATDYSLLSQLG